MPVAPAVYHGPPELTPLRALTEWTLDPWALAFALLLGGLYLVGARRARGARDGHWPAGRVIAFCGLGLGFGRDRHHVLRRRVPSVLFYVRAVQTVLLLLLVPLFLALGQSAVAGHRRAAAARAADRGR